MKVNIPKEKKREKWEKLVFLRTSFQITGWIKRINVFHQDIETATNVIVRTDSAFHLGSRWRKKRYDSEERQFFRLWLLINYQSEHTLQTDYVSNWPPFTITREKYRLMQINQWGRKGKTMFCVNNLLIDKMVRDAHLQLVDVKKAFDSVFQQWIIRTYTKDVWDTKYPDTPH